MYCQNCGAELADCMRFCPKCGNENMPLRELQRNYQWESRIERVPPSAESQVIDLYETFGWELTQNQIIDNSSSHFENHFGVIYSVTESRNYVTLSFRRNKNMPNYAQYAALEEKYIAASIIVEPVDSGKTYMVGAVIAILSVPITSIAGIAAGIFCIARYKKNHSEFQIKYNTYIKEREEANIIKYNAIQAAKKINT